MSKTKKSNASSRKQLVLINKRDIFDVPLDPYKVRCKKCGTENKKALRCSSCGNAIQLTQSMGGFRPVLVITSPIANPANRDDEIILAVPITSNIRSEFEFPNTVLLPIGETGLEVPSLAMIFNILSIDRSKFQERNRKGKISNEDWSRVESRLRVVMEIDRDRIFFGDKEITTTEAKSIIRGYLDCLKNHSDYDELAKSSQATKREYEQKKQEFFQKKGGEMNTLRKKNTQLIKDKNELAEEVLRLKELQIPRNNP